MEETEKAFLRECVNNQHKRINSEGKALIARLCAYFGIEFKPTLCQQCYHDAAFLILRAYRDQSDTKTAQHAVSVREGVDVFFNGQRVNNVLVTTTAECRRLIKAGMSRDYFTIAKDNETTAENAV